MTTDVSSRPRVGSAIDALIDHGIEIRTESVGVNPRGASHCFLERGSGHESTRPDGPQLCYRRAVTRNDDRAPCLNFTKDGGGLIAQLSLSDDTAHGATVAHVALRSNGPRLGTIPAVYWGTGVFAVIFPARIWRVFQGVEPIFVS